ncbi:anthrax toxin receptor-like isoform X2 [Bos mutus]|nr:PREDICTED: anthrax toxin receptor-like [Bos mutus]
MICPGIKIENPDEAFSLEISLNNGISFINSDVSLTSKDCASTRAGGPAQETTTPPAPSAAAQPPPETSPTPPTPPAPPAPPAQVIPYINPLYFFALIPALLLLSLMFCCIWWLCHRRTLKEPPPVLNPEREPEETCQMPCPTVIVPCGCQGGGMKRMEGKLDSLCDFVQRCNQMSVMWCPTRDMGKCVNFALMRPHCGPLHCSPKACVPPSRECFTINNCCSQFQHSPSMCSRPPSRMQPFISTPSRTANRAALSLQPP